MPKILRRLELSPRQMDLLAEWLQAAIEAERDPAAPAGALSDVEDIVAQLGAQADAELAGRRPPLSALELQMFSLLSELEGTLVSADPDFVARLKGALAQARSRS